MRLPLFILSILLLCSVCQAQNKDTHKILVTVTDSITGERLPFALLKVKSATDSLFQYTDAEGAAQLELLKGKYHLDINYLGYQTYHNKLNLNTDTEINVAMQQQSQSLSEVVIHGRKRLITISPKSIIYDMSKDKAVQASDLLSALKYVPLINVDANDNITVKGSGAYSIYLNGVPYRIAQSNPKEVLQSIPASTISKIEVITELDGRYDAETGNAILNIITTKRALNGYSLTLNGGGATQPKANFGTTLIATKGNVDFSVGYNYNLDGQRKQPVEVKSRYGTDESRQDISLDGKGNGNWQNHTIRALFSWAIDSVNSLYADSHGLLQKTDFKTSWEQLFSQRQQSTHSTFLNRNDNWSGSVESNIMYRNLFRKNKKQERFAAGYRYTYNPDVRNFIQQSNKGGDEANSRSKTNGGMNEHTVMADWTIPFSAKHQMRVGAKQIFRIGDTKSSSYLLNDGQWENSSPTLSANPTNMKYNQNISALYSSYTASLWDKLTLNASIRWEYAFFKMRFPGNRDYDYTTRHNTFLPHISIAYQPDKTSRLSLSYDSGIQRPGILTLNPFLANYSGYTGSEGNPDLAYSRNHYLTFNYMKYSNIVFLSCGLSYKRQDDAIIPYSYYNRDKNMLINTYGNIDKTDEIGANVYFNYRPISILSLMATGNIDYYTMRSGNYELKQNSIIYNATVMCDVFLQKSWTMGLQYGNYKNIPSAWGKSYAFSLYSFYVSKSFLDGTLNIKAVINSPFNKYYQIKDERIHTDYYILQTNFATARSIGINITYTIKSGKKRDIKRERSLQNSDQQTGIN